MAETIDEIAKTAPQQEKKDEQKPIGTLESVVNETLHLAGNTVKFGLAGLIPYTQATLFPHLARDTAILSGAQTAGDATTSRKRGKKYTAGNALESSIMGTALTAPLYYLFQLVHKIPTESLLGYIAKGAAWGGFAYPAYIVPYQFLDYVTKNRTLKGIGRYMKENYWPTLKRAWKYLLPLSLLNVFFAPQILNIPIAAALSYAFTLFGAPKTGEVPKEEKRDKTPYLVAASSVLGKLGKTIFYGVPNAVYAIGSGIGEKLYLTAKAPAKIPSPATAPAK